MFMQQSRGGCGRLLLFPGAQELLSPSLVSIAERRVARAGPWPWRWVTAARVAGAAPSVTSSLEGLCLAPALHGTATLAANCKITLQGQRSQNFYFLRNVTVEAMVLYSLSKSPSDEITCSFLYNITFLLHSILVWSLSSFTGIQQWQTDHQQISDLCKLYPRKPKSSCAVFLSLNGS